MMTPFQYSGFYDVPRYIALCYKKKLFLLQSEFDEDLDEYATNYSIYILPESVGDMLRQGSWDFFGATPMDYVGQIQVDTVKFDQSKRKELDASFLDDLIAEHRNP